MAVVCQAFGQREVAVGPRRHLAQHDVDRAGNRLRAVFGDRAADDFDAFDQFGRDRVEREAARRRFAIDQDLRITAAQPAHADFAAGASARAADGDAGQALQHVADIDVAVLHDLGVADHDLRYCAVMAFVGVGRTLVGNFDGLCRGSVILPGGLRLGVDAGKSQENEDKVQCARSIHDARLYGPRLGNMLQRGPPGKGAVPPFPAGGGKLQPTAR